MPLLPGREDKIQSKTLHAAAAATTTFDASDVILRLRNLSHRLHSDGDAPMASAVQQSIGIIEQRARQIIAAKGIRASDHPASDPRTYANLIDAKRKRSNKPGKRRKAKKLSRYR